jgi:hypothetical protein
MRNTTEPALLGQIFGDRANKRIKPDIAGQFRLALDRSVAILVVCRQIERVDEFSENDISR